MRKNSFAEKFKSLFSSKKIDEEFFEDLTDTLIEGDVGAKTAFEISDLLEDVCKKNKITTENGILQELKKIILQYVKSYNLEVIDSGVNIWMVLGVNGVGKTTSVAKLASYYKNKGIENIILASADTFRAATLHDIPNLWERLVHK